MTTEMERPACRLGRDGKIPAASDGAGERMREFLARARAAMMRTLREAYSEQRKKTQDQSLFWSCLRSRSQKNIMQIRLMSCMLYPRIMR